MSRLLAPRTTSTWLRLSTLGMVGAVAGVALTLTVSVWVGAPTTAAATAATLLAHRELRRRARHAVEDFERRVRKVYDRGQ